jgi:hypothetical protein
MRLKFHWIPARDSSAAEAELNAFLGQHRIVQVERAFHGGDGKAPGWAICIEWLELAEGANFTLLPTHIVQGKVALCSISPSRVMPASSAGAAASWSAVASLSATPLSSKRLAHLKPTAVTIDSIGHRGPPMSPSSSGNLSPLRLVNPSSEALHGGTERGLPRRSGLRLLRGSVGLATAVSRCRLPPHSTTLPRLHSLPLWKNYSWPQLTRVDVSTRLTRLSDCDGESAVAGNKPPGVGRDAGWHLPKAPGGNPA